MSGKLDRTSGTLKINGVERDLFDFRKVIGFVPQDDIFLRELSVEEVVSHSAFMRLPRDWSKARKLEKVNEILELLEIDHIRDQVIGDESKRGISGGQRKRVNIAMEMVIKPSLLCLDEPTSGLDSTSAFGVVQALREMADSGTNVISVLHQPKYEVFSLFDHVLLLGQGGLTVYSGPTTEMSSYFERLGFPCPERANPADFYMDVIAGIVPHATNRDFDKEDLFEAWMCAEENPDAVDPEDVTKVMESIKLKEEAETQTKKKQFLYRFVARIQTELSLLWAHLARDYKATSEVTRNVPGLLGQFLLLFKRASLQRLRTPNSTVLNIVLMVLAGLVLPALVPDDANLYIGVPLNLLGAGENATSEDEAFSAYLRQNVTPFDAIPGTFW